MTATVPSMSGSPASRSLLDSRPVRPSFLQLVEAGRVGRLKRLPEFPASCERVRELRVTCSELLHSREDQIEMVFQEMFEQTGAYCCPEVLIVMVTPPRYEFPYFFRIGFDVFTDR